MKKYVFRFLVVCNALLVAILISFCHNLIDLSLEISIIGRSSSIFNGNCFTQISENNEQTTRVGRLAFFHSINARLAVIPILVLLPLYPKPN